MVGLLVGGCLFAPFVFGVFVCEGCYLVLVWLFSLILSWFLMFCWFVLLWVGAGVLVLAVAGLLLDCYVCDSVVAIVVFRFVVGLVVIA